MLTQTSCYETTLWTPIFYAIDGHHEDIIKLLITQDLDIYFKDREGRTALNYAIEKSSFVDLLNPLYSNHRKRKRRMRHDDTTTPKTLKPLSNKNAAKIKYACEVLLDVLFEVYARCQLT